MRASKRSEARKELKERRLKRQRQQRMVTILIIAGAALVVVALFALPTIIRALTPVGDFKTITPFAYPQVNGNAVGNPDAPVQIIEYSDFQCPFCANFATGAEKQIIDNYVTSGKVYFVYRSFGKYIGQESVAAAEAAYCAGDQGKFWEYHDMLFANQTGENVGDFTDKRLQAFANALGLNMNQFNSCYSSHKYRDRVNQDQVDGKNAGASVTPSFIINGKLIPGALPFSDPVRQDDFKREIDAALTAAGG